MPTLQPATQPTAPKATQEGDGSDVVMNPVNGDIGDAGGGGGGGAAAQQDEDMEDGGSFFPSTSL